MKQTVSNHHISRREIFERARDRSGNALTTQKFAGSPLHFNERATHMRRTVSDRQPAELKSVPAPPGAAVVALSRLAYGPAAGNIDAFNALGATDAERLQIGPWRWRDAQRVALRHMYTGDDS
jgi:hypothetical protein